MDQDTMNKILNDSRVEYFSPNLQAQLNALLHQFDYTRKLDPYVGEGVVFHTEGLTKRQEAWGDADRVVFEHYDYFKGKKSAPELSYGLDTFFPVCRAVHLAGDHGQFLERKNTAIIVQEINRELTGLDR